MIVFTLKAEGKSFDLSFDSDMSLYEVVLVLKESSKLSFDFECDFWKSKLEQRLVSTYKSCREEGIQSGDILEAVK